MKNIHRIFEKIAEYKPYDFPKVNTVALITYFRPFWLQSFAFA